MTAADRGGPARKPRTGPPGDEYPQRPRDARRTGARILDTAEGVIAALHHCRVDRAFVELMQTAKQHGVNPIGLADALVAIAEGQLTDDIDGVAASVARTVWGHLLDSGSGRPADGDTSGPAAAVKS